MFFKNIIENISFPEPEQQYYTCIWFYYVCKSKKKIRRLAWRLLLTMLRTEGERHAIIFMMESLEGYMRKYASFIFAAKCLSSPPGEKSDQQSFRPHPDWSSYIIYTNICSSQLPAARLPLHRAQIIKLIRTEALNIFFLN